MPVIVIGVALVVRIAVLALSRGTAIDMDGTEYVRLAQNLLAGHGPVSVRGIPIFIFPPLYSWAIAALIAIGVRPESAGIAVALIAGVAFAGLAYALGAQLYGRRAGLAAGLIAAVLPACVATSTTVISESLYAALSTLGLLMLVRVVRGSSLRDAAVCGVAFGLSYLVRPEGALFAALACAIIVVSALAQRRSVWAVAVVAGCALIAALPAVAYSYAYAGRPVLEGKTAINFELSEGLSHGSPYLAVADAIDEDGRPVGPEIDQRYLTPGASVPAVPARERFTLMAAAALHHVRDLAATFRSRDYGAGALAILALIGFAAGSWGRERVRNEIVLVAYAATAYLALTSVWQFWPRYAMAFLPVVIPWAGRGIAVLDRWRASRSLPGIGIVLGALLGIAFIVMDVRSARAEGGVSVERRAGDWIAQHGLPASVVDVSIPAAFYAGATWSPLPYGDERAATRYLQRLHPTYVIIDSSRAADYPPLQNWFSHGLPSSLATRADVESDGRGRTLTIYRMR